VFFFFFSIKMGLSFPLQEPKLLGRGSKNSQEKCNASLLISEEIAKE